MFNGFYKELNELRAEGLVDADFGFLENIGVGDYFYLYDFLHGHCDEFAAALSDYYGYPIEYIVDTDNVLIHAYCVTEFNGNKVYIDVRGITTDPVLFYDEFADFCTYENGKIYDLNGDCQVLSHKNTLEMYNDVYREPHQDKDLYRFLVENGSYYDVKTLEREIGMKDNKHIVWSNYGLDIEDGWREAYAEFLEINDMDKDPNDENAIYDYMLETNDEYLGDERLNLGKIQFSKPIIVIADMGLWDGRHSGYKEIESGKIVDCLVRMNDYDTWYVDNEGDFRCDSVHHDGTNHLLYRVFKDDLSDEQMEDFKDKIYDGVLTEADIEQYTHRVGDEIAKVYGWEVGCSISVDEKIVDAQDRADKENTGTSGKVSYEKA